MADLIVQSRFAGLNIEDDEASPSFNPKLKNNKVENNKKSDVSKKTKSNGNKSQTANKKKKQKQNGPTSEQWEQWKQKDEELVDGNFETELQQAILLSKLDYEEKKDVYKHLKKESELEKKIKISSNNKKLKKKNVMSLEQFNDMVNPTEETKPLQDEGATTVKEQKCVNKDTEFFERVKDDTKNELLREKIIERVKNQHKISDEVITRLQFSEALERKNEEITTLREEIVNLKKELHSVKTRNKKLCNILGQGEMKDKAEVLMEVERLRAVQAELTTELSTLHTDLEKERSKNTDNKSRDKKYPNKKKSIRFDVSSEALVSKESACGTD